MIFGIRYLVCCCLLIFQQIKFPMEMKCKNYKLLFDVRSNRRFLVILSFWHSIIRQWNWNGKIRTLYVTCTNHARRSFFFLQFICIIEHSALHIMYGLNVKKKLNKKCACVCVLAHSTAETYKYLHYYRSFITLAYWNSYEHNSLIDNFRNSIQLKQFNLCEFFFASRKCCTFLLRSTSKKMYSTS